MQRLAARLLIATAVAVPAATADASGVRAAQGQVTAVQKVIQMLQGMLAKGKEEKHNEQVQFSQYSQFCSDVEREKSQAVKSADEAIDMLKANIELAESTAETLGREINELDGQVATWQADQKAATKVREMERADYAEAHKEYTETIDAIGKATIVLKAKAYNTPQAKEEAVALLSKDAKLGAAVGRGAAGRALLAFLAAAQDPAEAALRSVSAAKMTQPLKALLQSSRGPEADAYAYEFRSGDIIDMLNKLKDKFAEERSALEKEELNRRHAYELLSGDLKNSVSNAEDARSAKVQQKAKSLQSAAQMKSDLADTTSTRADDAKYLSEMTSQCKQKASDFEERQKLRTDEITALEKAIEILSSSKVQATSERATAALLQRRMAGRHVALLQVGSSGASPAMAKAALFLDDRAERLGSGILQKLAAHMREDPFAKVKKMIQDLIVRLQEAQGEEAQHNTWCKSELATNEQVRTDRTTQVERLSSEIETKKSQISKLAAEITQLTQQLAESDQETAKMTKLRQEEKAENEKTIKDAQDAQAAVEQAITLLKEFYATAGEATALVQKKRQEPPAIFDSPYRGMGAENGGVIAMLEVIQSDFARLESSTSASEATSQNEYDRQMSDSAVLKAQMQKDVEHKNVLKQQATQAVNDMTNDLQSAQKELDAANAYFDKLKPSCLESGVSAEERAQRRQEEIESLQEALRILNGEDLATTAL